MADQGIACGQDVLAASLSWIPKTGVYAIVNVVNGKVYIGSSSVSIKGRWNTHRGRLRRGVHNNRHLQGAWDKYGESAFQFVAVRACLPDECVPNEQLWIDRCCSAQTSLGYNQNPTAGSSLGRTLTAEHRKKISGRSTGRKHTDESRAKIGAAHRGKRVSEETREKMSRAKRGKKRLPHTAETRQKMSEASKGKPKSDEHRRALAKAKLGKRSGPHSEKHKENQRQGLLRAGAEGKFSYPRTEEYKKKQSLIMKLIWEQRQAGKLPKPVH